MYCKHCGTELDNDVKFCVKCGAPTEEAPPPKKQVDLSFFSKHYLMFYVVSGLCALLLIKLSGAYAAFSSAFTVVLGVFAILFVVGYLAVGIIGKVLCARLSDDDKPKKSAMYNICFAVSIILFVYIIAYSITVFMTVAELNNLGDLMSGIGSLFGN